MKPKTKEKSEFTTMKVRWKTKDKLDRWGKKGDTYDTIIERILRIIEDIEGAKPDFQPGDRFEQVSPKAKGEKN